MSASELTAQPYGKTSASSASSVRSPAAASLRSRGQVPAKSANDIVDDALEWDDGTDAGLRVDFSTVDQGSGDLSSRRDRGRGRGRFSTLVSLASCIVTLVLLGAASIPLWRAERLDEDLRRAVKLGDLTAVVDRLDSDTGDQVNAKGSDKLTALHWATIKGQTNVISALLDRRADFRIRGASGLTALHYAARNGHQEAAAVLLAHDHLVDPKDDGGRTPLQWAALYGHASLVKFLLEARANPLAENDDTHHTTAKGLADVNRHRHIVKLLADAERNEHTA